MIVMSSLIMMFLQRSRLLLALCLLGLVLSLGACGGGSSSDNGDDDGGDNGSDGGDDDDDDEDDDDDDDDDDESPDAFDIGVVIDGLRSGATLTLVLDDQTLEVDEADTLFTFPEAIEDGESYAVAISHQPEGQACTLDGAEGDVDGDDVTIEGDCNDQVDIHSAIVNHNQVTVDWSAAEGSASPDRFDLAWHSDGDGEGDLVEDVESPYTVEDLDVGENWYFTVIAHYGDASVATDVGRRIGSLGFEGDIEVSHPAPQGGIYVGGDFAFAGLVSGAAARLDLRDGQLMPMPEIVGTVIDTEIDDEGYTYLAGDMQISGDSYYLLRINEAGDIDHSWTPELDGPVRALHWFNDSLAIGGEFTQVNGDDSHAYVSLLDESGNPRSEWAGLDVSGTVTALASLDDQLVVGGEFQNPNTGNYLTAFDLSGDVIATPEPNSPVETLATTVERVYVGGLFDRMDDSDRTYIAALNAELALSDWSIELREPFSDDYDDLPPLPSVQAIAVMDEGLVFGGAFGAVNGTVRRNLAAVDADGEIQDWRPDPDNRVDSLLPLDGDMLVGGSFRDIARLDRDLPRDRYRLARFVRLSMDNLDDDGRPVAREAFALGADDSVRSLAATGDSLLVGGSFSTIGYWLEGASGLARLKPEGALDDSMEHLISGGGVRDIVEHNDALYLVGDFNRFVHPALSESVSHSVRLEDDGSPDPSWRMARPEPGQIDQALSSNNRLILGGDFTQFLLQGSIDRVAGINADGNLDTSWRSGEGPADRVRDLARFDGRIIAGGPFQSVRDDDEDHDREGFAAFDEDSGELDDWSIDNDDQSGRLARHGDHLILGYSDDGQWGLASLDSLGDSLNQAVSVDGEILRIRSSEVGLMVFGEFESVTVNGNNESRTGLALFSEAGDGFELDAFDAGGLEHASGQAGDANTVFLWNDRICVGGRFIKVSNQPRGNLACFEPDGALTPKH